MAELWAIYGPDGEAVMKRDSSTALSAWLDVITYLQRHGSPGPDAVIYAIMKDLGYSCRKVEVREVEE